MRPTPLIVALLLVPGLALAEARASDLDRAAKLVFDQRYEAAARALEQAARQTNNRREVVLRIFELQGVTYAQLGQETKAKAAFQSLLALDPRRELSGKYSGKALKPFAEAQAWAAENPALEASAEAAAVDPSGKVLQIAVKVKNDALKLARKVRFFVRSDGGKWVEQVGELQGAYASAGTDSDAIEWWAEVLGERDMILQQVGTQKAPVKEGRLRAREVAERPAEKKKEADDGKSAQPPRREPQAQLQPPPREAPPGEQLDEPVKPPTREPPSSGNAGVRAVGYTALALGMASLVGGTVMGVLWRGSVATLNDKRMNAERDTDGNIVSYPGVAGSAQSFDLGMQNRIRAQATAANVMWVAGGGLVILGIILYFAGRETAEVVQPGAGGLTVAW